ncbi:hypothetical protein IRT38_01240 (plasmid) [Acinetobacter sp. SK-43]|uniref:hypothetical protein n=1 Tax=Acinetobacter sp. SK-43 TaxID=2785295 RepID=UPI00188C1C58|nr:hypothetical protein [Acinetobacter sp. SK-43]MBF4454041.1 hypothetical protein [Acinetobacter sp. SK-43]
MRDFEIEVVPKKTDTQGVRFFYIPVYKGVRISKSSLIFDAASFNSEQAAQNFLTRKFLSRKKVPTVVGTWAF